MRYDNLWFGFMLVGEMAANSEEEKTVTHIAGTLGSLLNKMLAIHEFDFTVTPRERKAVLQAAQAAIENSTYKWGERVRVTYKFEDPQQPAFVVDIQHGLPDLVGN